MKQRALAVQRRAGHLVALFGLLADWRSRWRVMAMKVRSRLSGSRAAQETVELRIKQLDGAALRIRPGGSDLATVIHAFAEGQHLPPESMGDENLSRICELGANIGSSVAALAARYPAAEFLAVEPDPGNFALARQNLAGFGERCRLVQTGIWDDEVELLLDGDRADAITVRPATPDDPPGGRRIQAHTLDGLLRSHMPAGDIDYLHMCIEGTEPRVLAAGGDWPRRVRALRVELYPRLGFAGPDCVAVLDRLGYDAWYEYKWWGEYGFGIRR